MVQDLEKVRLTSQYPETTPSADSAFCKSYSHHDDKVLRKLKTNVCKIVKYASKLSKIDFQTEEVTKPLVHYSNGIIFEALGEAGHKPNDWNLTISLNLEVIERLIEQIPKQLLDKALLVFLCHESSHISQNLKRYEDVQRMKDVDLDLGRKRMGELDLRSDFLATHTLSCFFSKSIYNTAYIEEFYNIWTKVGRAMLNAFPCSKREDKQQRVFGYLLMSNLISDAYINDRPLGFNAELWPVWKPSLDWLSIYSNGKPFVAGSPIEPALMEKVLTNISAGEYDVAAAGIRELWDYLPRR
ncbi:hypothetical protein H6F90_29070 [Trichocoleus sp. FACHB-591]|uniref:hypothetical protein n=1 Tax=Trichocoleus sp. FACHB-591 TaxID=2692872 RepID=UPI00168708D8|nr:hypothetical protein [Trichocoleus sp. FACHB-591]MBD2099118.1 hypothetical protein [Trichocoleus sp. FACHB-591]